MKPKSLPKYLRYKKEKGGYLLEWRETDGSRRMKVLGDIPRRQAEILQANFYKDMLNKKLGILEHAKVTFRSAAESFLEYSRSNKRSFKSDVMRVAYLNKYFGDSDLTGINLDSVECFKKYRKNLFFEMREREMSVAALNRELATLKTIFSLAFRNGRIEKNPIQGLKLAKENNGRERTLTPLEYEKLLENCAEHIKPIVRLAYFTGMRLREILTLTWQQVDLTSRILVLEAKNTKTNERREIPLDDGLIAMLKQLPRALTLPQVFLYDGLPVNNIKTGFKAACRRAGLVNFRFHDLRHCMVTNLRKAGIAPNVIMSISGHKTLSMLKRYDRIDREDKQGALKRLGDFLETEKAKAEKVA